MNSMVIVIQTELKIYHCSTDGWKMLPSEAYKDKEGFRFVYCPYCSIVRKVPGESRSERVKRQNHERIIERMGRGKGHTRDAAEEEVKKEEKRYGRIVRQIRKNMGMTTFDEMALAKLERMGRLTAKEWAQEMGYETQSAFYYTTKKLFEQGKVDRSVSRPYKYFVVKEEIERL